MAENAPSIAILLVLERDDDPSVVVESILAQSQADLELIVADGSEGGVAGGLGSDPRLRVVAAPAPVTASSWAEPSLRRKPSWSAW